MKAIAKKKTTKKKSTAKKRVRKVKSSFTSYTLHTYGGKEVKKGGKWYPVTVKAYSLQEANKKVNKENTKDELRGRFSRED